MKGLRDFIAGAEVALRVFVAALAVAASIAWVVVVLLVLALLLGWTP